LNWLRPESFIKESYIEKELAKKFPSKNIIKLKLYINELKALKEFEKKSKEKDKSSEKKTVEDVEDNAMSSKEENIIQETNLSKEKDKIESITNNNINANSKNILDPDRALRNEKDKIFKQLESVVNQKLNLSIVGYIERDETLEEIKLRENLEEEAEKMKQEMELKNNPKAKKPDPKKVVKKDNQTPIVNKIREIKISNIKYDEKYNEYSKWISTNLQVIIDLNIRDVNTNETIFQKIYPQSGGAPEYNQSGRYWVKLYYMGKPRKIEIDDSMPCDRFKKLLLPHCDNLEELWPLIITKALLKLYSFKYRHQRYYADNNEDCSILYALTGYIGERISFNYISVDIFNIFKKLLSDENYLLKRKIMLCYKESHHYGRKKISKDDFHQVSSRMKDIDNGVLVKRYSSN